MDERRRDVEDKIPILGDVPVLGKLFSSVSERSQKRAILVFVSVRIIDPSGHPVNEI